MEEATEDMAMVAMGVEEEEVTAAAVVDAKRVLGVDVRVVILGGSMGYSWVVEDKVNCVMAT